MMVAIPSADASFEHVREKLGWIEQDHLVYHAIERFYDFEAHGASIVANMRDAQLEIGLITSTAPEYVVFTGGYRCVPL